MCLRRIIAETSWVARASSLGLRHEEPRIGDVNPAWIQVTLWQLAMEKGWQWPNYRWYLSIQLGISRIAMLCVKSVKLPEGMSKHYPDQLHYYIFPSSFSPVSLTWLSIVIDEVPQSPCSGSFEHSKREQEFQLGMGHGSLCPPHVATAMAPWPMSVRSLEVRRSVCVYPFSFIFNSPRCWSIWPLWRHRSKSLVICQG